MTPTRRAVWTWAPIVGLGIGVTEWMVGETNGTVRSLVWTASAFILASAAAGLAAGALARRRSLPDPAWLWCWFWLAAYGTYHTNVRLLPRQNFLTLPSLALTAGVIALAAAAALVPAAAIRAVERRLDRPFMRISGATVGAAAAILVVAIPLTMPRHDLTARHSPRKPGQRSVVLILIDTLRADRVSCYGYQRPTTPAIDALASRGTRYDAAWSPSSWTVPAVASLFSGLPLSVHRASAADTPFDTEPTLAGLLSRDGVVTAAFSANPIVSPLYRFERGFDLFVSYRTGLVHPVLDLCAGTTLSRLLRREMDGDRMAVDQATRWLEAHRNDRFFLYLHLFAPHRPYAPPERYRTRFVDPGYDGIEYEGAPNGETLPPDALANVLERYDAEIAYADSLVGEVMAEIGRLRLDGATAVIVTSDHGEAFGEHGYWEHGQALYVEETRVPLVARLPGDRDARVIRPPVSLADLHATLLELLAVTAGPAGAPTDAPAGTGSGAASGAASVSLARSLTTGEEPPLRPVVSEILGREGSVHPETLDAVTLGDTRLVRNITRGTIELYDRAEDPLETRPVTNVEVSRMLQAFLTPRWWEEEVGVTARTMQLSAEDLKRLRALGYVQ